MANYAGRGGGGGGGGGSTLTALLQTASAAGPPAYPEAGAFIGLDPSNFSASDILGCSLELPLGS